MNKKREDKTMFDTQHFDNVQYAKDCLTEAESKLVKVKIGFFISIAASLSSFLGFQFGNGLLLLGLLGGIASYIIGGGFLTALKFARKVAFWGWFAAPFPIDLVTGLAGLCFAAYGFLFFPLVFVYLNYRQVNINKQEAEEYLSYCR